MQYITSILLVHYCMANVFLLIYCKSINRLVAFNLGMENVSDTMGAIFDSVCNDIHDVAFVSTCGYDCNHLGNLWFSTCFLLEMIMLFLGHV